jgi:eukaryotic-like serine/threonine-protein kinase
VWIRFANDLDKQLPKSTIAQLWYLPMIRAATFLDSGKVSQEPDRAIEALAAAAPYELGTLGHGFNLAPYAVYLRGQAYLSAHQGASAATEFQKISEHPGLVGNSLISGLAHL